MRYLHLALTAFATLALTTALWWLVGGLGDAGILIVGVDDLVVVVVAVAVAFLVIIVITLVVLVVVLIIGVHDCMLGRVSTPTPTTTATTAIDMDAAQTRRVRVRGRVAGADTNTDAQRVCREQVSVWIVRRGRQCAANAERAAHGARQATLTTTRHGDMR